MNEHFIKNIEIKNFKCFKDFKAEGFARVNLIGGKNNVGKTAFIEAMIIASNLTTPITLEIYKYFFVIEQFREQLDSNQKHTVNTVKNIIYKFNKLFIKSKHTLNFNIKKDGFNQEYQVNNNTIINQETDSTFTFEKAFIINFIPSYIIDNYLISSIFDKIKEQRKRVLLNNILTNFDTNILEFDIIENKAQVFLKNINHFQKINELGHGLKRYIAIIGSIIINKNGFLFLDEIENGIHYTNLDKLWEIILTISKEQNVQIFATTHSKECIESYMRISKKLDDTDITYSVLTKLKNGELLHSLYDNELLETAIIEQEHEVR